MPSGSSRQEHRIKAGGDAADTAAGAGARELRLEGLDTNGKEITETVATAGASASAATTAAFVRLNRVRVSESGAYGTPAAGAHADDIVIEDTGGTTWATIDSTGFPRAASEIGMYTVPAGKIGFLKNITCSIDSTKLADFAFVVRFGADTLEAPFSPWHEQFQFLGLSGTYTEGDEMPRGPFPAHTDLGFCAKLSTGTSPVAVHFEVVLVDA